MACSGLGAGAEAAAPAPRSLCRALHTSGATPAGDNIKGPRDTKHNPLFQKLVMLLHFAHKAGGPNLDFNTNLANITEQCQSMVLTQASTEVAIKGRFVAASCQPGSWAAAFLNSLGQPRPCQGVTGFADS
ncbi:unnamed protein product [Natator depressus]